VPAAEVSVHFAALIVALLKNGELELAHDIWDIWIDYHPEDEELVEQLQEQADA
jgi:pentatricopeptide repeat protein